MVYRFTADAAHHYNCSSGHSSVFYQPLVIFNQSHGWGRGPTQQCVGNRKEYTLDSSAVFYRTHTLTPWGNSESPFNMGVKSLLVLRPPALKFKPEPFCSLICEVLCGSGGDHSLCSCAPPSAKHEFLDIPSLEWINHKYEISMCCFCLYVQLKKKKTQEEK